MPPSGSGSGDGVAGGDLDEELVADGLKQAFDLASALGASGRRRLRRQHDPARGALTMRLRHPEGSMSVVPLDPAPVRGSHGRLPDSAADGPVLLGPFDGDAYAATEVKGLLTGLLKGDIAG